MKKYLIICTLIIGIIIGIASNPVRADLTLISLVSAITGNTTVQNVNVANPLYGFGIPLQSPIATAATLSTGGTLASSTLFRFMVDASDSFGSTTPSNEVSTTTLRTTRTGSIVVTWYTPVNAKAARVYFAVGPTGAYTRYFVATTTGQYTFSTSSSALVGTPVAQTTAYSVKLNPLGTSYILGGNLLMGSSTGIILKDTTLGTCAVINLTGGALSTTSHACN